MQNRRKQNEITPQFEDSGLFKTRLVQVEVDLIPHVVINSRQDAEVLGFVVGNREAVVLFAGRRKPEASPLIKYLDALHARERKAALAGKAMAPTPDSIRCRVKVEGAWRPRFVRDETGWETRSYYLIAARWSFVADGKVLQFGELPVLR